MSNKAAGTTWDDYKKECMSEEERDALHVRVEAMLKEINTEESKDTE